MARKRASMREGPLAELFRATEAAQRGDAPASEPDASSAADEQQAVERTAPPAEPATPKAPGQPPRDPDATVEHVYDFEVRQPAPDEHKDWPAAFVAPVAEGPRRHADKLCGVGFVDATVKRNPSPPRLQAGGQGLHSLV